jgi:hypothetical protein
MPRQNKQIHKAWDFLVEHAKNGLPFSLTDLSDASGWAPNTRDINLSKKLAELLRQEDEQFFVKPEVLRVRYKEFEDLFGQKRRLFADYVREITNNVLVYEFFMPLTREDHLREALDNLFYTDAVEQRIREIGVGRIRQELGLENTLPDEEIQRFVMRLMEETIGGYSLSLVSGRFRTGPLATREAAAGRLSLPSDGPYLVDETTAVVRFILRADVQEIPIQENLFEPTRPLVDLAARAEQIRWLFLNFFAEPVTRVVRQEDEIWLLETGMKSGLYRWVRRKE